MFEFKDLDHLYGDEVDLMIVEKLPEDKENGYVPSYKYNIVLHNTDTVVGKIDIRIGYNEGIYYGGNIGYSVEEKYRGNAYSSKACKIIGQVAKAHDMNKVIVTCNPDNFPSRRTCEKLDMKLLKIVDLPEYNDMYLEGERQKCIFEWTLIE